MLEKPTMPSYSNEMNVPLYYGFNDESNLGLGDPRLGQTELIESVAAIALGQVFLVGKVKYYSVLSVSYQYSINMYYFIN